MQSITKKKLKKEENKQSDKNSKKFFSFPTCSPVVFAIFPNEIPLEKPPPSRISFGICVHCHLSSLISLMGGNALSKRLERAELTGVFALENADLDEIPPRLFDITKSVRVLDLSQNKINKMSVSQSLSTFFLNDSDYCTEKRMMTSQFSFL